MDKKYITPTKPQKPTHLSRIMAGIYDLMLAIGIYMVSGFFIIILLITLLIQLNIINSVADLNSNQEYRKIYYTIIQLWSAFWTIFFYIWFWAKGQTLGMKAWKLILTDNNMQPISKSKALSRFCWSLFGLGNILMFFNKEKLTLQDYISNTKITKI